MKLYRIEWDFDDYYGSFEEAINDYKNYSTAPTIPHRLMKNENAVIPRICLSDSILGCINAIGPGVFLNTIELDVVVVKIYYLAILVHEFDVDINDKNLLTPSELVQKKLVPDALQNNEYWYLDNLKQIDIKPYFIGLESMTFEKPLEYYDKYKIPIIATDVKLIDPKSPNVQEYIWTVAEDYKCNWKIK